jgi:hypothetical protein
MPRKLIALRLISQQRLVEQLGYEVVEEEEQLRPKSGAASAVPVERHDDFGSELPRDGYIGKTRIHRRRCVALAVYRS